jgi:diguanylate cyclase (GGDEF)-like protein
MRLRALAPWILLPPLLGSVLATWFVSHAVSGERAEMTLLAQRALRDDVVATASGWVTSETTSLLAIDAFTHVPSSMSWLAATGAYDGTEPPIILQSLRFTDSEGAAILERLRAVGGADTAVATVLAPLDGEVLDDLEAGRTGFVDPEPYADAWQLLADETQVAEARSADATLELGGLTAADPYWRDGSFLGFALALALLAITGGVLALWRVHSAGRDGSHALAKAHGRSEQLRRIITAARRMSADSDFSSLSRTLMGETRELLGGDLATLVRRDGSRLEPVVVNGDLPVTGITTGDGAIGRCVETGAVTRTIVPLDPFLPGVVGPLALLAAPLVADGHVIGAMVVASRTATMFDENDEAALQLLALLAAGAVTAAQRYDSTVALALHDPLTGLANRRRLDHDLATSAVVEEQVGFLMVDIDHFKAFNDRYGHQRGDELLRVVARAISAAVRDTDVVYRYGGEEFSVLLPATDAPTAAIIAERVRASVVTATAGSEHAVSVSVGVAAQIAPISPAYLVERADAALYAAKQSGRDRVSLA